MGSKRVQSGFGVVEVVIVVVILAAIGFTGWYVWQAQNRSSGQQPSTNEPAPVQNPQATDPYEGWKTYCDDAAKACFKYPTEWALTPSTGDGWVSAQVENPNRTIAVSYTGPDTRDGRVMPFYADGVYDLAKADSRFKVVGGFTPGTTNSLPKIIISDSSLLTKYPLKAGEQADFVNTARFTDARNISASLTAYPTSKVFTDNEAKVWFDSEDAKSGLLVLESFYLSN